jgi:signal transduction histidine kinase
MPGEGPRSAGMAAAGGNRDSTARRGVATRLLASVSAATLAPAAAHAQDGVAKAGLFSNAVEVIQFAVFAGVMGAALLSAVFLIRERGRIAQENGQLRTRVADLSASLQRAESMLNMRDQRVIAWGAEPTRPDLLGALPPETGAPEERAAFLAFGRWLNARSAAALDHAILALRERMTSFDIVVETINGTPLEVQGRKTPSHAIVRFTNLSEAQRLQARLKIENQRLITEYGNLLGLVDALKMPFWIRGADGRLKWVNAAYAEAVEAEDGDAAVREGREFLGSISRDAVAAAHATARVFEQTVSTVVSGDRRMFAVTDFNAGDGSVGIATDMSSLEAIRDEYEQTVRSHADTLDQLTTAVAIFDAREKLRFFNQAFQRLWDLDVAFLESAPDNALLLDRLRSEGRLAEQPEWRRWKEGLLSAYRSVESQEHWWHLPDGRTIRVVANPQPKGGVTWIFENLTEKMNLESRYNNVVRVQTETLDNLAEGVAVFGPDGRIRLANPALTSLWKLPPDIVAQQLHIAAIRTWCDALAVDSPWGSFAAAVTGFDDERQDLRGHTEQKNGTVLRYAVIHLPNGQVMLTFVDVTDSVKVERALLDKNEALQKADRLKNDFVQHVSYELRSPLTNIIGFTELLAQPTTGALTPRQQEYVEHIGSSSAVLLTIVNDILDLATVDAGIMELDVSEIAVERSVAVAAERLADRFAEHDISLVVDLDHAPKSFFGDETRVRQILYNLLSNAANFAPAGSTVRLSCRSRPDGVEFSVHDDGPGMAPEILDVVFRRFEPRTNGGRRRGAGLGLSIVKSFVELHGGRVDIHTGSGQGTTIVCLFPTGPAGVRTAAE